MATLATTAPLARMLNLVRVTSATTLRDAVPLVPVATIWNTGVPVVVLYFGIAASS